ncbi:histone deacetylase 15 isoform X2 [Amborella trichopoda]|uniref:histone deacetylase 15 isoform X2 n=1 Tax=Amborella trichopoda TaxID=13333 RepID=UPI0005D2E869|nr:histone deacetylase 15 isoform X2 [Amborella trichopoda]|eukprot:XP_020529285.1 histone deacetylase 15 isoform X2 [Amborella trichopoda]
MVMDSDGVHLRRLNSDCVAKNSLPEETNQDGYMRSAACLHGRCENATHEEIRCGLINVEDFHQKQQSIERSGSDTAEKIHEYALPSIGSGIRGNGCTPDFSDGICNELGGTSVSVNCDLPSFEGSNAPSAHSHLKRHKDGSFQDLINLYNEQDYLEDDDDNDSDWDPFSASLVNKKWFCINCTMANFDDVLHCDVCGEQRDTNILTDGIFSTQGATEVPIILKPVDVLEERPASEDITLVGFDEGMLLHLEVEKKPHPHPERPDRLRAIVANLKTAGIFPGKCFPLPAREITREELGMVHTSEHVEAVESTSFSLSSYFTPDTFANEHSARAARLAAGLCSDLASTIMSGKAKNGFALVRPPGHHAGVHLAMGFCLHNNAAVAALAAQAAGANRVLIVDWDVHHGNGTQEIFEANPSVLYISLHRHEGGRFYPGTGAADEVGSLGAEGYSVNVPWKCGGVGDNDYIFAFQHIVLPIAKQFSPDLTIISAGFDAARGDPLGCCDVTPAGFAQMAHMLNGLSERRLLVVLEGGYNLRSISSSSMAVIKVLLGEHPGCEMDSVVPSKAGLKTILEVMEIQLKFWPTLEASYMRLRSQWEVSCLQNKGHFLWYSRKAGEEKTVHCGRADMVEMGTQEGHV